jgi:hypothetical protein
MTVFLDAAPEYKTQNPRRQSSSHSLLRELEISTRYRLSMSEQEGAGWQGNGSQDTDTWRAAVAL